MGFIKNKIQKNQEYFISLILYLIIALLYFPRQLTGALLLPGDAFSQAYPQRLYLSKTNLIDLLWCPYEFLGIPFIGILQTGVFYPFNFLYFFLSPPFVYTFNIIFHYTLAGFFTFIYMRSLGVRSLPSFIAGVIFGFGGFLIAHKEHISMINAAIWLPLLLFLYEKIRTTLNLKYSALSAIVIAIQVFAGHYQISVYTYLVLFFFIFIYSLVKKELRFKFVILGIVPILFGSIIALPQIVATKELSEVAWRASRDFEFFTEYSFPPFMILQLIFPFFFGGGYGGSYWGAWRLTGMSGFVGTLPLIIGLWGGIKLWRKDLHVRFWVLLALLSFALALGGHNPFYKIMYYLPIYNLFRCPGRHFFEFNLAIAVLFGLTLNFLVYNNSEREKRYEAFRLLCIVFLIVLLIIFMLNELRHFDSYNEFFTPKFQNILKHTISFKNPAIFVPIIFLMLYIFIKFLFLKRYLSEKPFLIVLTMIVLLESWSFGGFHDVVYFSKKEVKKQYKNALFYFLQKNLGFERALFITNDTLPLYNLPAKIQFLNGYDPLILHSVYVILDMMEHGVSNNWIGLLRNNLILSTVNVRYIIVSKDDVIKHILDEVKDTTEFPRLQKINLKQWNYINSKEQDGQIFLLSPNGKQVSMISQQISLHPNRFYLLSLEAHYVKNKPTANLSYDLYGPNYDFIEQELIVDKKEIKEGFRTFYKIIFTGEKIPPQVELRVFTFSKEPIVVRNVEIKDFGNYLPSYQKVFESDKYLVYENRNSLPKAFSISYLKVANDLEDIKKKFHLFEFNPSETALVSNEDLKKIGQASFAKGKVKIEKYSNSQVIISAEFPEGDGFLVLADQYFPGWKAYVDGKEVNIYCVNGLLRGVVVPKGNHIIEFRYYPMKLFVSCIIGFITFIVMLIVILRSK